MDVLLSLPKYTLESPIRSFMSPDCTKGTAFCGAQVQNVIVMAENDDLALIDASRYLLPSPEILTSALATRTGIAYEGCRVAAILLPVPLIGLIAGVCFLNLLFLCNIGSA